MRPIVLALVACLLLPCVSAGNTVDYTFTADYRSLHITLVSEATQDDASNLRHTADSMGNNDGTASQSEIDAMLTQMKPFMEGAIKSSMGGGNFTIDGQNPLTVKLLTMNASNASGAVSNTETITMTLDASATYAAASGTNHTLVSIAEPSTRPTAGPTGTIVIHAGSSSVINESTGRSDGTISSDRTKITYWYSGSQFPDATVKFGGKPTTSSASSSSPSSRAPSSSSSSAKASSSSSYSTAHSSTSSTTSKSATSSKAAQKSSPDASLGVLLALVVVAVAMRRRMA